MYCKAVGISTVWYWNESRYTDQQHQIDGPETHTYTVNKHTTPMPRIHTGKRMVSLIHDVGETGFQIVKNETEQVSSEELISNMVIKVSNTVFYKRKIAKSKS